MNEPGFEVGLVYLGVVLALLLVPAMVVGAAAKWASPLLWQSVFAAILMLAAVGVAASFLIEVENPGDQYLYRSLVIGFALSTAAAAWAVDRIRKRGQSRGLPSFVGAAIGTQFLTALIIIMFPNC